MVITTLLLIGTYFPRGRSSFVVPGDPGLEGIVPVEESRLAEEGDVVKVALAPDSATAGDPVIRSPVF